MIETMKNYSSLISNIGVSCLLLAAAVYSIFSFGIGANGALTGFLFFAAGMQITYTFFSKILRDLLDDYDKSLIKQEKILRDNKELLTEKHEMLSRNPFLDKRNDLAARIMSEHVQKSEYIN